MAVNNLTLQIVTPEREVFSGEVDAVKLPGMDGSFGVLRGHAPMFAGLQAGVLEYDDLDGAQHRMAIGGGFFKIENNVAMVLADSAEDSNEIDVERARQAESRARSRLAGQMDEGFEMQREEAEASLKRARARLRSAGQ